MLVCQLISGYTQSDENWNGVHELREKLLSELDNYSSLSVRIRLDTWNSNWRGIARQLYMLRERYDEEPFAVVVFAYSWGVGHGLVKLAKYLNRYGVNIDHAVLSDGIYRHWFSAGNWRVLVGKPPILLPPNIIRVDGFYQETSWPSGVKPVGPIEHWELVQLPHIEMDDSKKWHTRCIQVAKQAALTAVGSPHDVPASAPISQAVVTRTNGHSP
jgi:hypothetical protein